MSGSHHVYNVARLFDAPYIKKLLKATEYLESVKQEIIHYANKVATTINSAVAPDGSNAMKVMINSLNLVQLSAWHANMDTQFIVSIRH